MKVLTAIIAPPHLSVSGAARAAERLSVELAKKCDVSVASMMPRSSWDGSIPHVSVRTWLPAGMSVLRLPNKLRTPFYRSDIPDTIRRGGFDMVHLHNPMPALEMARIAAACRRSGTPYVVSTHGFHEIDAGARIYDFGRAEHLFWDMLVYRAVVRATASADAVLLLSEQDRPVVRRMGLSAGDTFVVPNGAEPAPLQTVEAVSAVLQKFAVGDRDPEAIVCMFLANHTPNKGLPVLFEAFSSLDIPFLLIVCGERRQNVDYVGFAGSLRERQRVIFTGRLEDGEVMALMRGADAFVFPSLADTLPLVVQEALSVGLPVIASAVGGVPRQIDRSCGILVPPGDPQALADAVRYLAEDRTVIGAMSQAAHRRFREMPSWSKCAGMALTAYRNVLERRGRQREMEQAARWAAKTSLEASS